MHSPRQVALAGYAVQAWMEFVQDNSGKFLNYPPKPLNIILSQQMCSWQRCNYSRSDFSSTANALRSLWPISTSQSSPSPSPPRLANGMKNVNLESCSLKKVDAYVFFHLPGQFLNEDSLSKVRLLWLIDWLLSGWKGVFMFFYPRRSNILPLSFTM